MNYEQSEYFKLAIRDIFRVRKEFFLIVFFVEIETEMAFITNFVPEKVEKENQIRNVRKSEERKVKTIGKVIYIANM